MNPAVLHYIHDPLCGWCYGAAPLLEAARGVVTVRAHGGGMMAGAQRQRVTPQLREYVLPHDRRIAQLTGQPFGAAYTDGLLRDETAVFDSEPPTAAMLAAEAVAGRGLDLLARLQQAHYAEGRRIADRAVLLEMAAAIGLPAEAFERALSDALGGPVQTHIRETRELMAKAGVHGFPGLLLEAGSEWRRLDASQYLGRPQALADDLRMQLASIETSPPAHAGGT